mgnify:CR=1 FL=1
MTLDYMVLERCLTYLLCYIMDIRTCKYIPLFCVSNDIMIMLSSMRVTLKRGLTQALDTGDHQLQLKSFCIYFENNVYVHIVS